jgi:hypothetical protein
MKQPEKEQVEWALRAEGDNAMRLVRFTSTINSLVLEKSFN